MTTTIYFAGAITGGRGDLPHYQKIVESLRQEGYRVLAGAVAESGVSADGEAGTAMEIFERDLGWIGEANVLVAEVSLPSIGVGYEIAAARYRFNIPVICLYRQKWTSRCTAMVAGDATIEVIEYADEEFARMFDRLKASLESYCR